MEPLDPKLLDETQPISDDLLDELANTLDAATLVAEEMRSHWQPRDLRQTLESVQTVVQEAQHALRRAASDAESARIAANRCWECGSPLVYDPHGSRWCRNPDCELCQRTRGSRLQLEFLADPATEQIKELCQAYWRQGENGFFVHNSVKDVADVVGYPHLTKLTHTVITHCRAITEQRCEDCDNPIGRYKSRAEYRREHDRVLRKCKKCLRPR